MILQNFCFVYFTKWLFLQVPSYISRSVAGSYDNEAVAIFALIFTFYLYIKVRVFIQQSTSSSLLSVLVCFCRQVLLYLFLSVILIMKSMQMLNTGSLFYATLNAIAYFYMVRLRIILHVLPFSVLPFSPQLSVVFSLSYRYVLGEVTPSLSI